MQSDGNQPLSHCLEKSKVEAKPSWGKGRGLGCAKGCRGLVGVFSPAHPKYCVWDPRQVIYTIIACKSSGNMVGQMLRPFSHLV